VFGSDQAKREQHYFGLDARWRSGPFSLDPTFIWLLGSHDMSCAGLAANAGECDSQPPDFLGKTTTRDVNAWIVDLRGGWRTGPLLLEGFFLYVPGNKARDNLGNTAGVIHDQNFFTPINTGGGFGAGWTNFLSSNSIDYIRSSIGTSMSRGSHISFDRYGAIVGSIRPSYALTKALTLNGLVAASWTAEEVDTHGVFVAATGHTPTTQGSKRAGDDSFLGWELATSLVWGFAPGLTFDMGVAHLFAGDALDQCMRAISRGQCGGGGVAPDVRRDARDASSVAARVRFSF
jgi:hypothetical protein